MTPRRLSVILAVAMVPLFVGSLMAGPAPVRLDTALLDLWQGTDSGAAVIVAQVRLPRALLAILIGGSLGLAGAVKGLVFRGVMI